MIKYTALLVLPLFLLGCATLTTYPEAKTQKERLGDFPYGGDWPAWPVSNKIRISWHERMVPFVEAEKDEDAAFAIGVVHAHLRLGQMEFFRRASAGRLAESGGPFVVPDLDRLIRTLDLGKSSRASFELLSPEHQKWLTRYVEGVNYVIRNMKDLPPEYGFLNWDREEWDVTDSLRVGRLATADVNWGTYFTYLQLRSEPRWQELWQAYLKDGERSVTSFDSRQAQALHRITSEYTRSGSNSYVVSGKRTKSGAALIASDPHLGIFAPNLWILMGYKTPTYHVLGYMLPGVPAVTIGRNKDIAWGGTYMRGISSHLFEVTKEDIIEEREEHIGRRWWFDKKVIIRETTKGPIISDLDENLQQNEDELIALNWMGHRATGELGSFLGANKARNWKEFRNSFKDYAVSGLNMTYADKEGNIALLLAIRLPVLADPSEHLKLVKSRSNDYASYLTPLDLPYSLNPPEGFIASANNMPVAQNPQIAIVSSQNDRIQRLKDLLGEGKTVSVDRLKAIQLDVYSIHGAHFKEKLVAYMNGASIPQDEQATWEQLKSWDAKYTVDSRGAVAYEAVTWQMAQLYFKKAEPNETIRKRILGADVWRNTLETRMETMTVQQRQDLILEALEEAEDEVEDFATWGEMHRQIVRAALGVVPVIGGRFTYEDYGAAGGPNTVNKGFFPQKEGRKEVVFGSQSRHVSDLGDPNENYFVMLGGNDGWLNSPQLNDQVDLWKKGKYVKLPLEIAEVRKNFTKGVLEVAPLN